MKSSKQKQKLYIKFLKNRPRIHGNTFKSYKQLFEKIKNNSKGNLLQPPTSTQNIHKKTWNIMKEIIGKNKLKINTFPKRINVNNGTDI